MLCLPTKTGVSYHFPAGFSVGRWISRCYWCGVLYSCHKRWNLGDICLSFQWKWESQLVITFLFDAALNFDYWNTCLFCFFFLLGCWSVNMCLFYCLPHSAHIKLDGTIKWIVLNSYHVCVCVCVFFWMVNWVDHWGLDTRLFITRMALRFTAQGVLLGRNGLTG